MGMFPDYLCAALKCLIPRAGGHFLPVVAIMFSWLLSATVMFLHNCRCNAALSSSVALAICLNCNKDSRRLSLYFL